MAGITRTLGGSFIKVRSSRHLGMRLQQHRKENTYRTKLAISVQKETGAGITEGGFVRSVGRHRCVFRAYSNAMLRSICREERLDHAS